MTTQVLSPSYDAFEYAHTAATTTKIFLLISSKVVLPLNTAAANETNVFVARAPRVRVPKATGEAWTPMQLIYLKADLSNFTTTATSNTLAGRVVKAAASADTEGEIELDPSA